MICVKKWSEPIGRVSITNGFTFYEFKLRGKIGDWDEMFRDGTQYPAFKRINFRLPQIKRFLPGKGE